MQERLEGNCTSRNALVVTHARLDGNSAVVNQVTTQLKNAGFGSIC